MGDLILINTLRYIKDSIEEIYEFYKNNLLCNIIYSEYKKIFSSFETKIKTPKMRAKLVEAIKKSKRDRLKLILGLLKGIIIALF